MTIRNKRTAAVIALTLGAALTLSACSSAPSTALSEAPTPETPEDYYPITVTDMAGNEVTIESADSVGVFQNQSFGVLESWGIAPTVAPRTLMSESNGWKSDESILDTGSHREPNFELVKFTPALSA